MARRRNPDWASAQRLLRELLEFTILTEWGRCAVHGGSPLLPPKTVKNAPPVGIRLVDEKRRVCTHRVGFLVTEEVSR
jgi:hypothetical protein